MQQGTKIITGLVLLMCFVFSISFVSSVGGLTSANVSVTTPAASAIMGNASFFFNVSIDSDSDYQAENYTQLNIWIYSATLTANTSQIDISGVKANVSEYEFSGSVDTSGFEDGNDYIFVAVLNNGTDLVNQSRTGLIINNTVPGAPTLSTPADQSSITSSGTQTFTYTVGDANTVSCTYTIDRYNSPSDSGSASGTGTYSAASCSFTKAFSSSSDNGDYSVVVTASDGSDTTGSTTGTFHVQIPGAGGGSGTTTGTTPGDGDGEGVSPLLIIGIIVFLAVLAIILCAVLK